MQTRTLRAFTLVELPAVSRCKGAAFTLVELLVVIGIIAVLVAMLLPSLNKARASASRIACASNLRQITISMVMFANEHRGSLPTSHRNWRTVGAGQWQPISSFAGAQDTSVPAPGRTF